MNRPPRWRFSQNLPSSDPDAPLRKLASEELQRMIEAVDSDITEHAYVDSIKEYRSAYPVGRGMIRAFERRLLGREAS